VLIYIFKYLNINNNYYMKHLSYEFPSEAGQRWDVRPINFRSFFMEQCSSILIPLFQRKYCWTEDQIKIWFYDLTALHPRFTSGRGHSVGKIMFKSGGPLKKCGAGTDESVDGDELSRKTRELICIDGQQRITTTMLSLAALRDAVYTFMETQLSTSTTAPSTVLSADQVAAYAARLHTLTADIDAVIFSNIDRLNVWETTAVDRLRHQQQEKLRCGMEATSLTLEDILCVGDALDCSRLQPSYLDRAPFFECILVNKINRKLKEVIPPTATTTVREATMHSVQYKVKTQFDALILTDINKVASCTPASATGAAIRATISRTIPIADADPQQPQRHQQTILQQQVERFFALFSKILDYFSFVYMEFLNDDISLPQLFLWLQEKSIFSMGALLYNPAPGIKFHACDLVRNLLMSEMICQDSCSTSSSLTLTSAAADGVQAIISDTETDENADRLEGAPVEDVYRELWIYPIENAFTPSSGSGVPSDDTACRYKDMDSFLEAFANYVQNCIKDLQRLQAGPGDISSSLTRIAENDLANEEPNLPESYPVQCCPEVDEHLEAVTEEGRDVSSSSLLIGNPVPQWMIYYHSFKQSSFEKTLDIIVAKFGKAFNMHENKGVFLYARIYALYENLRKHFDQQKTKVISSPTSNGSTTCFSANATTAD
jgi:hypothetical protein